MTSSPLGHLRRPPLSPILLVFVLVMTGCRSTQDVINLDEGGTSGVSADRHAETLETPLHLAAAPVLSLQSNVATYAELVRYLEVKLERPVELLQRKTYAEVNDLVKSGRADIALVCGGAYVEAQRELGMELLVAPVKAGEPLYYSNLIVPTDGDAGKAASLADFEGKSFAFTDPLSNSGRLVPLYQVVALGKVPEQFFATQVFTYGHDNSIRAVAEGLVAGAAVDSWVYEELTGRDPSLARATKVIARWGPYGAPPVVVSPKLDSDTRNRIRDVFLEMDGDSEGQKILADMGLGRFIVVDDSLYDPIREMRRVVND